MNFRVKFSEQNSGFVAKFGEVHNISDGGFERGYAAGYEDGNTEGYTKGHTDGVEQGYAEGYEDGLDYKPPTVYEKDVNYYDYDGTILYSYTASEALSLSEAPALPERSGLICQGWNVSLEAMQSYVSKYGKRDVGATYITDDGKTRLYITIASEGRMTVPLYIRQTVANGVTIDWGDGSATKTLAGTGVVNTIHAYTQPGDYVISLNPVEGCTLGLGNGNPSYNVLGPSNGLGAAYSSMLKKVEFGALVTTVNYMAFSYCRALSAVTIPEGVTSIGGKAFERCYSLTCLVIPNGVNTVESNTIDACYSVSSVIIPEGVTKIGDGAFRYAYSLDSLTIPESVTNISSSIFHYNYGLLGAIIPEGNTKLERNFFGYCESLANIVIPKSVTTIRSNAFTNCSSLAEVIVLGSVTSIESSAFSNCTAAAIYDFTACTAVPTLAATSAFTGIPSDCEIRVPASLADEWKAATNWSTYAANIVGV